MIKTQPNIIIEKNEKTISMVEVVKNCSIRW
jgi:hypothetical protein